jgi:hypothetical protein
VFIALGRLILPLAGDAERALHEVCATS